MSRNRHRIDALAVSCVLASAALAGGFAVAVRREARVARSQEETLAPAPLPIRYRNEVSRIVGVFLKSQASSDNPTNDSSAELASPLASVRHDLLALMVPISERDMHLRLVVAVTAWEEGIRAGDLERIRAGSGQLTILLDEFPWLGEGFSNP